MRDLVESVPRLSAWATGTCYGSAAKQPTNLSSFWSTRSPSAVTPKTGP